MEARLISDSRNQIEETILNLLDNFPRNLQQLVKDGNLNIGTAHTHINKLLEEGAIRSQMIKESLSERSSHVFFKPKENGIGISPYDCKFIQEDNIVYRVVCDMCLYRKTCVGYEKFS
jgi:predicted transcriptional regulator